MNNLGGGGAMVSQNDNFSEFVSPGVVERLGHELGSNS